MRRPGVASDAGDEARATLAALIDRQLSTLGLAAMDALVLAPGDTVVDIGCGAGETLLQLQARVGGTGHVIGVDIGPKVMAVARKRVAGLTNVTLIEADAATIERPDGSIDRLFSRFGVMFFADPIAAFGRLRRLLKVGGRLGFVCWRRLDENELDRFALEAAGLPVESDAAAFGFARPAAIEHVLHAAGFTDIAVKQHDAVVICGDVTATASVLMGVGALGAVLRSRPALRPIVAPRVQTALRRRERDGVVPFGAATWIVTAST